MKRRGVKLFYRIKRDGQGLWVKMYSDCKHPWFAALHKIDHRKEAHAVFMAFAIDVKKEICL